MDTVSIFFVMLYWVTNWRLVLLVLVMLPLFWPIKCLGDKIELRFSVSPKRLEIFFCVNLSLSQWQFDWRCGHVVLLQLSVMWSKWEVAIFNDSVHDDDDDEEECVKCKSCISCFTVVARLWTFFKYTQRKIEESERLSAIAKLFLIL